MPASRPPAIEDVHISSMYRYVDVDVDVDVAAHCFVEASIFIA